MKREEVVKAIESMTGSKLPSGEVEQRIRDIANLHAILEAMDTIKVILQGLPEDGNIPAAQMYFPTVQGQLIQLIQKLPTEEEKKAVITVLDTEKNRFRKYKKGDYVKFSADVKDLCRLVLMEYMKQRMNAIIANKKEAQHV